VGLGETDRDEKLDKFIAQQRGNPAFSEGFVPSRPAQQRKPSLDTLNLSREQFDDLVAGKSIVK
jgi:hypothetical protein